MYFCRFLNSYIKKIIIISTIMDFCWYFLLLVYKKKYIIISTIMDFWWYFSTRVYIFFNIISTIMDFCRYFLTCARRNIIT